MRKSLVATTAALALAGAFFMVGCACSAAPAASDGEGITVSASSETKVVPDRAEITVAVLSQAETAEACQEANARDVNAVIEALLALGVAEEDIQTEWTNLSPIQDYENVPIAFASAESTTSDVAPNETTGAENAIAESDSEIAAEPTTDAAEPSIEIADAPEDVEAATIDEEFTNIVGYEMYTSLSVKGIEIDSVGAVTAGAISAGATDASGIRYYASSYDEAYEAALQDAINQARQKAQVLAEAAGVRLGSVVAVTEGYQDTGYRYAANGMAEASMDASDASMKVMPGEIDISAQVTVRFAIA